MIDLRSELFTDGDALVSARFEESPYGLLGVLESAKFKLANISSGVKKQEKAELAFVTLDDFDELLTESLHLVDRRSGDVDYTLSKEQWQQYLRETKKALLQFCITDYEHVDIILWADNKGDNWTYRVETFSATLWRWNCLIEFLEEFGVIDGKHAAIFSI